MAEVAVAPIAPDPMLPRIACVRRRHRDGPKVWTLEIESEGAPAGFTPGQFNMLTAFGVGRFRSAFPATLRIPDVSRIPFGR